MTGAANYGCSQNSNVLPTKDSRSAEVIFTGEIKTGAEQTDRYLSELQEKNVGIITNQSGIIGKTHIVDSLLSSGIKIIRIFSPEHGFRGDADAGEHIKSGNDAKTGINVVSLYGSNKKPTKKQLENIDIMIFDLQDVGVRFYTYISTMHYVMEACAENNIPLIILDRPNPNGHIVDGPVLDTNFRSFVGMHPVPVLHGMTVGEYARMINGEKWLKNGIHCELTVIACENYNHNMKYKLPVAPSPNLRNSNAIALYPHLCFFEATKVSVGRGTDFPFEVFGSPDFPDSLFNFKPVGGYGSKHPKYENVVCYGYDLRSEVTPNFESLNLDYLIKASTLYKNKAEWIESASFFDKLAGGDQLRIQLKNGLSESEIRNSWQADLIKFNKIRTAYLIYR